MVSLLRDIVRSLPLQEQFRRPLPKSFVEAMLRDPEYRPVPPEACECAMVGPAEERPGRAIMRADVVWVKCTRLGELNGRLADSHVRIGTGDYLAGAFQLRMCRRVR